MDREFHGTWSAPATRACAYASQAQTTMRRLCRDQSWRALSTMSAPLSRSSGATQKRMRQQLERQQRQGLNQAGRRTGQPDAQRRITTISIGNGFSVELRPELRSRRASAALLLLNCMGDTCAHGNDTPGECRSTGLVLTPKSQSAAGANHQGGGLQAADPPPNAALTCTLPRRRPRPARADASAPHV